LTSRHRKSNKLVAYLTLVRFPAVFTAVGDVLMGLACATGGFRPADTVLTLVLSSAGIYLAGMALNDLFDRQRDAVERPERPIPSGAVAPREAGVLGGVLLLAGCAAAWSCGPVAGVVAAALAALAVAYDAGLKTTPGGPLAMGACRGLNVLLGAAGAGTWASLWSWPQAAAAASLAAYVSGLTWVARGETDATDDGSPAARARRAETTVGVLGVGAGLAGFVAVGALHQSSQGASVLLILAVVAAIVGRRLWDLWRRPSAARVHRAVRTMLYSILVLDAAVTLLATGRPELGLLVLALLVPHLGLQVWFRVT